ncbi:tubulin glycylase 3A-like [Daktulosphaira vitifoliae]|uniref:tubulin glycylase 3A-like n=1 Tax=Daktulosphaira vitifoliae TaxID=58002 RepID=UPI0021AA1C5C|nr:tubulin glycylase 3A-like [Daktulosphaira vitifoliae]
MDPVEKLTFDKIENIQIWSIIKDATPNYIFTTKWRSVNWNSVNDKTVLSQVLELRFCTKHGLTNIIEKITKQYKVNYPRSYNITDREKLNEFIKDYRLTALMSSLKSILEMRLTKNPKFNPDGTIPYEMIDFIEQRSWEFINAHRLNKINEIPWLTVEQEGRWKQFMIWYTKLLEENGTIRLTNSFQINNTYERFTYLVQKLRTHTLQFDIDGSRNIWIIKPSSSCSGYDIKLEKNVDKISKLALPASKIQHYTIQKYIENPLLIFNVKIDLRQYFLVTNFNQNKLWMYKEGYIRFCSKEYSITDLSENIHLSNVRIQSKYRKYRAQFVPEECMWSFEQFKQYLASTNNENKWDNLIYPKMCETLISVFQYSNMTVSNRFSFQLLGADFVLTTSLEPWLIEINSNPGLNPTTSIISKIATRLLKDIVKGSLMQYYKCLFCN